MKCSWTVFCFLVIQTAVVFNFNIEERRPILKEGAIGSYFGFSVALHRIEEYRNDFGNNWLLVGAPLGKNLQPSVNESGALFKCPVDYNVSNCEQIPTDGFRFDDDYDDETTDPDSEFSKDSLMTPGLDELKRGQWLGVNVRSQKPGGKIIVCAHRYIQSPNLTVHHYGYGLCYVLKNDFRMKEQVLPCYGKPVERLHQQYGLCQAGTSLSFLESGVALFGAPGPFTWRGAVFEKNFTDTEDIFTQDTIVRQSPLSDDAEPLDKYSYLGMSVTGGHYFNKSELVFASGAPRSHWVGEVFFFTKGLDDDLPRKLIIRGDQFGSSFGYEITSADINNDGYDDLLVGAPFYFGDDKGGSVHVFYNLRTCKEDYKCKADLVLYGKEESRFGLAITSLGDINKDGYTDIAIGAPYDEEGAIFIHLGSMEGLQSKPSQVIRHHGVRTFGYSLSGGLDMNSNSYPDLLVGAYESDVILFFKTRPVIDIEIVIKGEELKKINGTKKGCPSDRAANTTCFFFQSCFSIKHQLPAFEVKYHIKEVNDKRRRRRIYFKDTLYGDEEKNDYFVNVNVTRANTLYCQGQTAYIDRNNRDIISPIKFKVNYTLNNDEIDSPILNKTSVNEFFATFVKDCGGHEECKSKLILDIGTRYKKTSEGYIIDFSQQQKVGGREKFQFLLDVNITNEGEAAYEANLYVVIPPSLSFVSSSKLIGVNCSHDVNNKTLVICYLGNPLRSNGFIPLNIKFEIEKNSTDEKLKIDVFVNSTSTELSNKTSGSIVAILRKVIKYSISGTSNIRNLFYGGDVKGESDMQYQEDIGPSVNHTYQVSNTGHWALQDVQVTIAWPYQVHSQHVPGKWLLYLTDISVLDGGNTTECRVSPPDALNPLKLRSSGKSEHEKSSSRVHRRRKRDVEYVAPAELTLTHDGKEKNIVSLDCYSGTTNCAIITCDIGRLTEGTEVFINVNSRIWTSTLVEDYSTVDWIDVRSFANMTIADTTLVHSNQSIATGMVLTVALPGIILADTHVNIWIIIGSVLAGFILLIILIIVLYYAGFFKRNRPDHTNKATLSKQDESESLLKINEVK